MLAQFKIQAAELAKQRRAWQELADRMSEAQLLAICDEAKAPQPSATPVQVVEFVLCIRSAKVHVALDLDAKQHHMEWEALCGWKLASGRGKSDRPPSELYIRGVHRPQPDATRCSNCFTKFAHLDESLETGRLVERPRSVQAGA